MHEVAVCESILKAIEAELPEDQRGGLREIHVRIGILSGVEPQLLKHAYQFVTTGTLFEKVSLHTERVEVLAECTHCQNSFKVDDYIFVCPECGEAGGKVVQGNELEIYKLIIEVEELSHEEINQ